VTSRLVMLLFLWTSALNATPYVDWVVIDTKNKTWPVLLPPSLALGDEFEFAPATAAVPASFSIMRTEVSCAQVLASSILDPIRLQQLTDTCEFAEQEPVTGVSFKEATRFCRELGGELPTEAEWVFAASLAGNAWLTDYQIINTNTEVDVESVYTFTGYKQPSYDTERSPQQLHGILASVWEITQTPWPEQYDVAVMKGGAFDLSVKPELLHPYYRAAFNHHDIFNKNIGFRCVR